MRVSGSRMRLLSLCQHWAREDVQAPPTEPGRAALMGTALAALIDPHGDSAAALAPLTDAEVDQVTGLFETWKASPFANAYPLHEVPFAYDVPSDSGRVLPKGEHRDYSLVEAGEIPGTADLVHVGPDCVTVADVKSGWQEHLEPVHQHSQLRFLALVAARAYMVDRAVIQILHIHNGELRATEATLEAADLDAVAAEVRALVAAVPNAAPRPGGHCTDAWCPALAVCPRTQALVQIAVPDAKWTLRAPETNAEALRLREGAKVLAKVVEQADALWKAYGAEHGAIALPDGRVLREGTAEIVSTTRGAFAEAEQCLAKLGLAAAVERETKVSCSRASIERAAKALHPGDGRKAMALARQAMDVLRRLDCVVERPNGWKEAKSNEAAAAAGASR